MKQRIIFLSFLLIGLLPVFESKAQCNIQASICTPGVAGPFNFQNGGYNSFNSTCLDQFSYSQYAFIVLYITQSGNLNMLISGNASSGFLDVAAFNIPSGVAPCTAIQNSSNQINCNYASGSNGCNQFGTAFGCSSNVPSVAVTAGQTIMIVVEDWEDGASSSFTLQLASTPGSAQTGPPNATILASSLTPMCTTDGPRQLSAVNNGGTWSGPGVSASGMFNPATAGPGVHTINYSIGTSPCIASSSAQITVGSVQIANMVVGACSGGQYAVTGNINVLQPPATGQLIVENCDGQQTVLASAPFAASYPFNLGSLNANGAACNIHAYFSSGTCSMVLPYTAPTCPPGCSFTNITATPSGCVAGNTYNVNGTMTFSSAPSTGQLIVSDCNGNTQTFNPPFTSPTNYSFSSLVPNGQSCNVTAYFTNDPACTRSISYNAPGIPIVVASNDVSICGGGSANISASGATTYFWDNSIGAGSAHSVSPSATTTYTVTGTTNGCTATDQVVVNVGAAVVPVISPDVQICEGESTVISASGGTSYLWNNGLGTGDIHTVSPSSTTTYNVTITDANGCTGTAQTTVNVNSNPIILASNVNVCETETVDIVASGANSYVWSPANYLNSTIGSTVTFTPGISTTYSITGTDVNGCVGSTTVDAIVNPTPIIEAGNNLVLCDGDQIILSGSGAGAGGSYSWSGGVTNGLSFSPLVGNTVYTVTGTSVNGCFNTDSLTVTVDAFPNVSFTTTQDQFCVPVQAQFINTSSSGTNCIWIFDNGQTVNGCGPVSQTFTSPGVYGASLYVESINGCASTLYQDSVVLVDITPDASFMPNPVTFPISSPIVNFNNNSTGAVSYVWDFGYSGSTSSEVSPNFTYPGVVGNYTVTLVAISVGGCVDTFQYSLNAEDDLIFYVPNTFTPDGDSFNQTFQPIFTSGFDPQNFTLYIFNRWGEILYESHDATIGWDGTYGGSLCQEGSYTWKIEFKSLVNDERKMYLGHLNLIR